MNRDLRRLTNTIRRLQHEMSRRGVESLGVKLNDAGDEISTHPAGTRLSVNANAKKFAAAILAEPVKETA